jgi:hypothetical protein
MLGVTGFGLIFTPAFYSFIGGLGRREHKRGVPCVSESWNTGSSNIR